MGSQPMRTTQLIFNHGPGAILETVDGPAIVRNFSSLMETDLIKEKGFPDNFEIFSPRLSEQLVPKNGQKVRLHWLPSNAELGKGDDFFSIRTNVFPGWMLCNKIERHSGNYAVLFRHGFGTGNASSCPECDESASAIRFVKYCNDGHLDDISWRYHVCGTNPSVNCKESHLEWREVNSSMQGVTIRCPSCNKEKILGDISRDIGKCSGRHPEKRGDMGINRPMDCELKAKITQRQSTILWQSASERVISVPTDDKLGDLMKTLLSIQMTSEPDFNKIIELGRAVSKAADLAPLCSRLEFPVPTEGRVCNLLSWIEVIVRGNTRAHQRYMLDKIVTNILTNQSIAEFQDKWERIVSGGNVNSALDSYKTEWEGLVKSPRPVDVLDHDDRSVIFSMEDEPKEGGFGNLRLKFEPIQRLRSVTALTGFTRGAVGDLESQSNPKIVDLSHNIHGDDWYAASPAFGEGILITLDEESEQFIQSDRWGMWEVEHERIVNDSINEQEQPVPWVLFRSPRIALMRDSEWKPNRFEAANFFAESHPLFVWWHTFAHHLIRSVQAETGYSSSAISERIYAIEKPDGTWTGAVLLYVTEGGMDGTLGGLISLLPNIQIFLDRVRRDSVICSMDPLCEEGPSRILPEIGCYACTFNSETSCEHRNMFLDRLLMIEGAGI